MGFGGEVCRGQGSGKRKKIHELFELLLELRLLKANENKRCVAALSG